MRQRKDIRTIGEKQPANRILKNNASSTSFDLALAALTSGFHWFHQDIKNFIVNDLTSGLVVNRAGRSRGM